MRNRQFPRKAPSFPRTLLACVIVSVVVSLPLAIWQGDAAAHRAREFQSGILGEILMFVLLLAATVGGIAGCLVFTLRNLWWSSRR